MKFSNLSVKRRPAKKPVFRKLFANVRRKQNVAVAAPMPDVDGDVPNLGIARALVVILIIHVVAIAGIFAHSKWFEKDAAMAVAQPEIQPAPVPRDAGVTLPKIVQGDETYVPVAGDTYQKIALEKGVEEPALREANSNIEIRAGRILRIPPRTIVAVEPPEIARLRQGSAVLETADAMPNEEAAPAPTAVPIDELRSAPMVETAAASAAVVVKPRVNRADAAQPVAAAPAPAMSRKYTVKSGDTFYKIAKTYNTTADVVMKANRISDPRKLKPGMQLSVP